MRLFLMRVKRWICRTLYYSFAIKLPASAIGGGGGGGALSAHPLLFRQSVREKLRPERQF